MHPDAQPVIIRRVRKTVHAHHGGSWKVAYADFVTAMMALFIVLWVLAQNEKAKNAVAMYFTDPTMTPTQIRLKLESLAANSSEILPTPPVSMSSPSADRQRLEELAGILRKKLNEMHWTESLKGQLIIEMTDEGLRIEFLDCDSTPFFAVGSAEPMDYTREALTVIAGELGHVPNCLAIEGHTDSRPFVRAGGYGNFELSAGRANAARRVLESAGVRPGQVSEVRGLADVRLRNPDDPLAACNRRVSVIVRFMAEPATAAGPARDGPVPAPQAHP